jgi:hypothetical protein
MGFDAEGRQPRAGGCELHLTGAAERALSPAHTGRRGMAQVSRGGPLRRCAVHPGTGSPCRETGR